MGGALSVCSADSLPAQDVIEEAAVLPSAELLTDPAPVEPEPEQAAEPAAEPEPAAEEPAAEETAAEPAQEPAAEPAAEPEVPATEPEPEPEPEMAPITVDDAADRLATQIAEKLAAEIDTLITPKILTAPYDPRFPNTNQARHCFIRYNEFHKCVYEREEEDPRCQFYKRAYESMCPADWLEEWQGLREEGLWYGKY